MILDGMITALQTDRPGVSITKDKLPRGGKYPALVLHRYGLTKDYDFNGPVGVVERQVQIDVYGNSTDERDALSGSVVAQFEDYTGDLPDGTTVQACYLEREMDMPYMSDAANTTGNAYRTVLGFRLIVRA